MEQLIKITLTPRERALIDELTFVDPSYIERLKSTGKAGTAFSASFSADELEDLTGCVAADANHTKSKKLEKELDALFEKLKKHEKP